MGWHTRRQGDPWTAMAGLASLTAALQSLGPLRVVVLRQALSRPRRDERRALRLTASFALVREIELHVGGVALVAARSVLSVGASRGAWRAVRGLGHRSLGSLLFADPAVSRSVLVFGRPPARTARQRPDASGPGFGSRRQHPARRSVFVRQGQGLLVMERFLPALLEHLASDRAASASLARASMTAPDSAPRRKRPVS